MSYEQNIRYLQGIKKMNSRTEDLNKNFMYAII